MASLNFKGKSAVWNHHLSVPYHTLEKVEFNSLDGKNASENLLIEWDNLLALKALLPKYQGKIKCIYIDPPYNTGNEGWAYNDNVSNPIIKTWMGEIVDKDNLTRHDRWLCMMTPRLKLLRELLSEYGMIFISIDENEQHHLRVLLNEIFGDDNHVSTLVWAGRGWKWGTTSLVEYNHEYVEVFSKNKEKCVVKKIINVAENWNYSDEESAYKREQLRQWGQGDKREDRPSMYFPIEAPDGTEAYPFRSDWTDGRWRVWESTVRKLMSENNLDFIKDDQWRWSVYRKIRDGKTSLLANDSLLLEMWTASSGTIELKKLFWQKVFETPKPTTLIKHLVDLVVFADKEAIILDSFSWSGTTAQAVMELNQNDNWNRKFILVQLPETLTEKAQAKSAWYDFVHEITRDRIKKVVEKYGLTVGFTYYTLGPSIEWRQILEWESLPSWESFAKYVHFLATGKPIDDIADPDATWEICTEDRNTGVYLIYADTIEELRNLAITRDWLESVKSTEGKKIVYAPACFLDKEVLDDNHISFVQVPYNLFQRK
jgi:adenine-specific DNA-methyltransferase